jgi:hypothetical protein
MTSRDLRHGAPRFIAALFAAAVCVTSAPALAQDVARESFERGMQALQGGRYADAVRAFERSYAERPVSIVQFNLGLAYRGLGRATSAIAAFERYLQTAGADTNPQELANVRAETARLRATLATLRVRVNPPDAIVRLDGQQAQLSPDGTPVDPGPHVLDVTRDGSRPEHRELLLSEGSTELVEVTLVSAEERARLVVIPSVLEASVIVDSVAQGSGYVEMMVPAGEHNIEVRALNYLPFSRRVRSDGRAPIRLYATMLLPPPRRPRPNHTPMIAGITVGATVLVTAGAIALALLVPRPVLAPYVGNWGSAVER